MTDSSFSAYLDSLRILWYRRIVSFDQESQVELWALIRETISEFSLREWLSGVVEFLIYWWKAPWNLRRLGEVVGVLAAMAVLGLLIMYCVRRDRLYQDRLQRERGKSLTLDPVRRLAGRRLQRMRALVPPQAEPDDFRALVSQLEKLRYGPPERRQGWREILRHARRATKVELRQRRRQRTPLRTGA